jgi:hypothetical protein
MKCKHCSIEMRGVSNDLGVYLEHWCPTCGTYLTVWLEDNNEEEWEQPKVLDLEQQNMNVKVFVDNIINKVPDDALMDHVADLFDFLFNFGNFYAANKILETLDVDKTHTQLLMQLLVWSRQAYDKMPYHKEFFKKVEQKTKDSGEWTSTLLKGLDTKGDITFRDIMGGINDAVKQGAELKQTEIDDV